MNSFHEVIEIAGLKGGVLAVIPAKSCSHGSSASCPGEASLAKPKDLPTRPNDRRSAAFAATSPLFEEEAEMLH